MIEFAHPHLLLALPALAVPVVIHLVSRMLAMPWRFPSIRFIRALPVPRRGRRRPSDLALLALRLLLVAGLIVGLARPGIVLPASGGGAGGVTGSGRAILVVDLSSSMSGWRGFDEARVRVGEWLDRARVGEVGLIGYARGVMREVAATGDRGVVRGALDGFGPVPRSGDPSAALRRAVELLEGGASPRLIVVVSDLQESDWAGARLPALPPGVGMEVVPVGRPRAGQVAIVEARAGALPPDRTRVTIGLASFLDAPVTLPVRVAAGAARWETSVGLAPRARVSASFDVPGDIEGPAVASIPGDAFPGDDLHHFWLGRPSPVRVLFLLAREAVDEAREERFFLEKAVTIGEEGDWVRREFHPAPVGSLTSDRLAGAGAVVVPSATAASGQVPWGTLAGYVRGGGLLIVTLDARAPAILRAMGGAGLTRAVYDGVNDAAQAGVTPFRPSSILGGSALAELFEGNRDLFLLPVRRHVRLGGLGDESVLIRLEGGAPLLVSERSGEGATVIFPFPLDLSWSDLPLRASFLPLVRELLAESGVRDGGVVRLEPGSPLPGDLAGRSGEGLSGGSTDAPGAFRIGPVPVEVNVPRSESMPESVSAEEIRAWMPGATAPGSPAGEVAGAGARRLDLWPWLLALVALWFVGENLLVGWLDRIDHGESV